MQILTFHPELEMIGMKGLENIYWQLNTAQLYEQAVRRHEGMVAHLGPLAVRTGNHTHHSAHDSFIVREPSTMRDIAWGDFHHPLDPAKFDVLYHRILHYLQGSTVFVQNVYVGANKHERLPVRIITETAWHSLFARDMFFIPNNDEINTFLPEYTLIHVPGFRAIPEVDGTRSDTFVTINFAKRLILIGGTSYAGEIKKALFSVMGYLLPAKGALPLRGAVSKGGDGSITLFLGRSGTGKTTLATGKDNLLIADDELVWTEDGIFSLERGGYAQVSRISQALEPEIYSATRRYGTILENAAINPINRRVDLDDISFTDNVRATYPLTHLLNAIPEMEVDHPKHIILLTTDMFGVLPPVARLSREQALYFFRAGYVSRLVDGKPTASFSGGFDELMMPLHPGQYATMFEDRLLSHKPDVWLINTGWTGGGYGVGERIKVGFSKLIARTIEEGELAHVDYVQEPHFGLHVPVRCSGVFEGLLRVRDTWRDKNAYDQAAHELSNIFTESLDKYYALMLEE